MSGVHRCYWAAYAKQSTRNVKRILCRHAPGRKRHLLYILDAFLGLCCTLFADVILPRCASRLNSSCNGQWEAGSIIEWSGMTIVTRLCSVCSPQSTSPTTTMDGRRLVRWTNNLQFTRENRLVVCHVPAPVSSLSISLSLCRVPSLSDLPTYHVSLPGRFVS